MVRWIHEREEQWVNHTPTLIQFLTFTFAILLIMFLFSSGKIIEAILSNIALFTFFSFYIYRGNRLIDETMTWDRVEGIALSVQIVSRICLLHRQAPYYPRIKYTYIIDGNKYYSDQLYRQKCTYYDFREEAVKLGKKLTKDGRVLCYVNPNNPNESVLIANVKKESYLIFGLVIFFVSFFFLLSTLIY